MIYFLHGNNQTESRNKLNQLIDKAKLEKKEIIKLNGQQITLTDLKQALESTSLFGQEKMVVMENLFSRVKSKLKDNLIKYLKTEKIKPDFILWEKKQIPGTTIRWLPKNWQYMEFKIPVWIFKFLDSIKPGNCEQMLKLLKKCLPKDTAEMVFYMLVRQIRLLLIAKDMGKKGLSGAPWYIGKLCQQASFFTLDQLKTIYKKMLQIDINIKTGKNFMPLVWQLDLLLIKI